MVWLWVWKGGRGEGHVGRGKGCVRVLEVVVMSFFVAQMEDATVRFRKALENNSKADHRLLAHAQHTRVSELCDRVAQRTPHEKQWPRLPFSRLALSCVGVGPAAGEPSLKASRESRLGGLGGWLCLVGGEGGGGVISDKILS